MKSKNDLAKSNSKNKEEVNCYGYRVLLPRTSKKGKGEYSLAFHCRYTPVLQTLREKGNILPCPLSSSRSLAHDSNVGTIMIPTWSQYSFLVPLFTAGHKPQLIYYLLYYL